MDRKNFLIGIGMSGLATIMLPLLENCKKNETTSSSDNDGSCVIIPEETAGPYPLDLSKTPSFFRKDITEGKAGLSLSLSLAVVNVNNNCAPITNARVDVWHCDKDGVYSGYSNQTGGVDARGETFCRGIQLTDSNGLVDFTTIYPGWYNGRITHIHFQVYLNNGLVATSQIAFPEEITKAVYNGTLYVARGQNTSVASNAADSIFGNSSADLKRELCSIVANNTTGGYDATLNIGIAV